MIVEVRDLKIDGDYCGFLFIDGVELGWCRNDGNFCGEEDWKERTYFSGISKETNDIIDTYDRDLITIEINKIFFK